MSSKILSLEPQRRNAVLNAALKEFALRGYDNASTNVIAKEAGISKALMFHYVSSKQELFLIVYDYFSELLDKEYFSLINFTNRDIFERFRQSYLLQIELLKKHPWIFEFNKLSAVTKSDEINEEIKKRALKKQAACNVLDMVDESKFRAGLDAEKCKQFIIWANFGFANEILENIRNSEYAALNYELIVEKLDEYLEELKKIFYNTD